MPHSDARKQKCGGLNMTVKIDGVEPNIFPDVDDLDARDAGRNVEVFLDVRIEAKPTPVTVKLSTNKLLTWPLFWSRSKSPRSRSPKPRVSQMLPLTPVAGMGCRSSRGNTSARTPPALPADPRRRGRLSPGYLSQAQPQL